MKCRAFSRSQPTAGFSQVIDFILEMAAEVHAGAAEAAQAGGASAKASKIL